MWETSLEIDVTIYSYWTKKKVEKGIIYYGGASN